MTAGRQLSLPLFGYAPRFEPADFVESPSNAAALAWLDRTPDWPQLRLALWGPPGSGKTHLLHIWAARLGAQMLSGPAMQFVPPARPLAIDDADAAPERALLHTLNAAAEAGLPVLLAGRAAPARWDTPLADLASRLRAITAVEIAAAEEALLHALLGRLLAERRIGVPESVQDWLRLRLPRTAAAMREAAARLDEAARDGGAIRALARRVLAEMSDEPPSDGQADGHDEDFAQSPHAASSAPPLLL